MEGELLSAGGGAGLLHFDLQLGVAEVGVVEAEWDRGDFSAAWRASGECANSTKAKTRLSLKLRLMVTLVRGP